MKDESILCTEDFFIPALWLFTINPTYIPTDTAVSGNMCRGIICEFDNGPITQQTV